MKKASGLILLLALSGATLWATDYSVILQKATENSPEMRNAELTYQNSLLTQQQNDLDDSVKVTVSTGETGISIPFQSTHEVESILGGVRQSNTELSLTPTVEVVLPNDGQTTITATSGLGFQYADGSYYRVEPGISASHTFDLTGFDSDLATSISNARSSLLSEQTWQNARLSFENSVLTSIRAIVQAEQQLAEAQYNLSKAEKTLSDAIQLGNVTEGSVSYQQSVNNINLQKNNIAAYEEQIAVAGQQYTTLTGLVWDGVENLPSPDLSFQILDGGNTNVVLAQMDVQIAEQAIATKNHELNPSGIRLSGGVSGTLSSEDNNVQRGQLVCRRLLLRQLRQGNLHTLDDHFWQLDEQDDEAERRPGAPEAEQRPDQRPERPDPGAHQLCPERPVPPDRGHAAQLHAPAGGGQQDLPHQQPELCAEPV